MDISKKIIDALTKDDIIDIMGSFNIEHEIMSNGDLRFQAHCHGSDSKKLYYYEKDQYGEESKHFLCYSNCGGMSVYSAIMKINNWNFGQAFHFLAEYKGISVVVKRERGFGLEKKVIKDWDFISRYRKKEKTPVRPLMEFDKNKLNVFSNVYPSSWESEGISTDAMKKFNIMFHLPTWKAVIPHYDMNGRLVGIRGRAFLEQDILAGKKYMPMFIEGVSYRHPLQYNLYGLYQNIETIKKLKKIIIFEGEKSVLMCETFYPNNNFSVAICGNTLSNYQRDLIIQELGVEEIIIAIDKQYQTNIQTEEEQKEYEDYVKKVKKIANKFVNFINVYIVYCEDDRLEYKDSPCDKGKEILEQLMKEKERYVYEI